MTRAARRITFQAVKAALPHNAIGLALLCCSLATTSACGPSRSYELKWTLGCDSELGPCEVQTARDCSSAGVDAVEVVAIRGGSSWRSVFACFSAQDGALGRGQDLSPDDYGLEVYTLSASGHRLISEPALASVTVPEEGFQPVDVDLAVRPQCSDGVDNDRDVRVDLFDPGCIDLDDLDESE